MHLYSETYCSCLKNKAKKRKGYAKPTCMFLSTVVQCTYEKLNISSVLFSHLLLCFCYNLLCFCLNVVECCFMENLSLHFFISMLKMPVTKLCLLPMVLFTEIFMLSKRGLNTGGHFWHSLYTNLIAVSAWETFLDLSICLLSAVSFFQPGCVMTCLQWWKMYSDPLLN